ncbi:hypothetical protein Back11_20770 [Paenibacillus baekrokdamisoli]|uniref:Uncharacterized protein n=1 Tax=Paenibacillus baekrokdamisoli TaxID=1712516 RepID=A0A3G9IR27_9BACL|nr:hypothetical protein [Paenibacillus baekrokdamisoli]MBB3069914.1 hypothetical protein [Paenibacillus baekrokdamisoli]BBH20732.1 hypothetical protein Back11_20770 [Paenibacillus baekrokdamisoli]
MGVPVGVWVVAAIIVVLLAWMTIWITNKAYSKRWEDHEHQIDKDHK